RALFCTNVVAVLVAAIGQILINYWIITSGRPLGRDEFHFFPQVLIHQSGYYVCACSFLLIIGERLILCYKPAFYEDRHVNFISTFISALFVEILMTIPVVTAMQYEHFL
ncbi:hypothetical protein PFISCL1PPCAC_14563, partial [Pristionchus fissidentatus]